MEPVRVEVMWPGSRATVHLVGLRSETVRVARSTVLLALGLQRCKARDSRGDVQEVAALVEVPGMYKCDVRPNQWATEKLAWMPISTHLSRNNEATREFRQSGEWRWLSESLKGESA